MTKSVMDVLEREYQERQLMSFIVLAGISLLSLVMYNAGIAIQNQALGVVLFFCPAALYALVVKP